MQLKDVWTGLGHFFEWTFQILPVLGNFMNLLLFIIGWILFIYWISQMVKHNRAGEA